MTIANENSEIVVRERAVSALCRIFEKDPDLVESCSHLSVRNFEDAWVIGLNAILRSDFLTKVSER